MGTAWLRTITVAADQITGLKAQLRAASETMKSLELGADVAPPAKRAAKSKGTSRILQRYRATTKRQADQIAELESQLGAASEAKKTLEMKAGIAEIMRTAAMPIDVNQTRLTDMKQTLQSYQAIVERQADQITELMARLRRFTEVLGSLEPEVDLAQPAKTEAGPRDMKQTLRRCQTIVENQIDQTAELEAELRVVTEATESLEMKAARVQPAETAAKAVVVNQTLQRHQVLAKKQADQITDLEARLRGLSEANEALEMKAALAEIAAASLGLNQTLQRYQLIAKKQAD